MCGWGPQVLRGVIGDEACRIGACIAASSVLYIYMGDADKLGLGLGLGALKLCFLRTRDTLAGTWTRQHRAIQAPAFSAPRGPRNCKRFGCTTTPLDSMKHQCRDNMTMCTLALWTNAQARDAITQPGL